MAASDHFARQSGTVCRSGRQLPYFDGEPDARNVGWLQPDQPFPTGEALNFAGRQSAA
jgi:hypothetical protein